MNEQADLQVFYLNDLAAEDMAFLRQKGISIESVQKMHANREEDEIRKCQVLGMTPPDKLTYPQEFVQNNSAEALLAEPEVFEATALELERNARFTAYTRTMARNGTFAVDGVFSDGLKTARRCYVTTKGGFPTIGYLFRDEHDFLVIANGVYGHLWAVYIPDFNLLIMFKKFNGDWGQNPEVWLNTLNEQMRCDTRETEDQKPQYANLLSHGFMSHYHWNLVSGLWADIQANGPGPTVFTRRYAFPPTQIFERAGIDTSQMIYADSEAEVQELSRTRNFMFGLNSSFLGNEETAQLSYEVAKTRAGQTVVDEAARFGKKNRITVWILLRSIHRSWIDQVDGIAHYINALQEKYGPCSFVFDGHTVLDEGQNHEPDGAEVVERNNQSIAEEQANLEEILKMVSVSDYKNLIGSSVYEKIVWAHTPTFTIQPFGSGFIWTGWIANRPAVVHIPPWANAFFRAQAYTPERSQPRVFVDNSYYTLQNDPPSKEDGYFLDWRGVMAASDRLLTHLGYEPKAEDD